MKYLTNILLLFIGAALFAQKSHVEFRENKGQWDRNVFYKAKIPGGNLYLEQKAFVYQFYDEQDIIRIGELHHESIKNPQHQDSIIHFHAFKVEFLDGLNTTLTPSVTRPDFENYFIGKDRSKWASQVRKFEEIVYQEIYPNIGLKFYQKGVQLKYDFNVLPGGDPAKIQLSYKGVDEMYIEKGDLHIKTSVNNIIEQKPYAYQLIKGKEKEVKCKFILKGNILSFEFPKGYRKEFPLVIDPTLIFASYSGSTIDNWGYTSTFDELGNLYGGGVSFGVGYPFTLGAYQMNFAGGNNAVSFGTGTYLNGTDITISKFSSDGSSLLYSTYLGGSENEAPHSLIVNNNDELLILGTTSSPDFPVSINGFDTTYNGGNSYIGVTPSYTNGSDIVVSKLSSNGSLLLSSTYIGGSGNDGLNTSTVLGYNYGDDFRGEIVVDSTDNVYVASSTLSSDFPVTPGVIQPTLLGSQDGCVFKLSPDLSILHWSTYLGGTSDDASYSLQFDRAENILVTGGTSSNDFPVTLGSNLPTFQGGVDGWIAKMNNTATALLAATYVGTSNYNQTYFVQLDTADNVYVIGQTEGAYSITPATVYNNPNSGQFLHKFSSDLSTTIFSTTFGTSSGFIDIALSAFLVNECNYILVSGWGGATNVLNSSATFSTTNGLPITSNALQSVTDGSDYYLAMFSEDADTLLYATFFGGGSSSDHVDGGTSRFDKKGIVYQTVCSSCGFSNTDFPTTPGAWSNTDSSLNCNLAVFKIDLTRLTADADVYTTPFYCIGDTVPFRNLSNGGISYSWDFGDGDSSSLFEPLHRYDSIGTYRVRLIALDSISCIGVDTDYVDIFIGGSPIASLMPINGICYGDSVQLNVGGGTSYIWSPNYNILNDSTSSPTVWPDTTTTYTVIVFDSCGVDTAQIIVTVFQENISIMEDTSICAGQSIQLSASGGGTYSWSPGITLNDSTLANPNASPTAISTTYHVIITDLNGCSWDTSMIVTLDTILPIANAYSDTVICLGDTVSLNATGGSIYSWSPISSMINANSSSPMVFPTQSTNYIVSVENGCGVDTDTIFVAVQQAIATAWPDTLVCPNETVQLFSSGGNVIGWNSENNIYKEGEDYFTNVRTPSTYTVTVQDSLGCQAQASLNIGFLSSPTLDLGEDKFLLEDRLYLKAIGTGSFRWTPSNFVSCDTCSSTFVFPNETTTFTVFLRDSLGCITSDQITIFVEPQIWAPNAFTPNGDRVNDVFFLKTFRIQELELSIFNRWGELIFYTEDKNETWNGFYKGELSKTEVYVWEAEYKDHQGKIGTKNGKVVLLR